jgi:hypothetical protein
MLPRLDAVEAEKWRRNHSKISKYYPDTGQRRRELYVKHMEFFRAGACHRERLMLAANRVGKTEKASMWAGLPPHVRDARSKGIPALGQGAIYPIPEEA